MSSQSRNRIAAFGVGLATMITMGLVAGTAPAAAATDTTPPSVPQNLRSAALSAGYVQLSWDASTDDSGSIYHYWVLVDGVQKARPAATTYKLSILGQLCQLPIGPHTVTVQAVDHALNRSAPSAPITIVVV
jgi:hypothetical protein